MGVFYRRRIPDFAIDRLLEKFEGAAAISEGQIAGRRARRSAIAVEFKEQNAVPPVPFGVGLMLAASYSA